MPDTVVYTTRRKNQPLFDALVKGFKARAEPMERARLAAAKRHVIAGLQFGALEILQQAWAQGAQYVFVDRGYFGGGPNSGVFRLTDNAYQKHWVDDLPSQFLMEPLPEIQPWQNGGEHLLLVPPSAAICRLFELGDWEAKTLARLQGITKRPVRVSYKGDPEPLSRRLDGCHAVVTWTSNVAVDAVMAGVPAFVSPHSAALPVARGLDELETQLERPLRTERLAWAESLMRGQASLDMIEAGALA